MTAAQSAPPPASGEQFTLEFGEQSATVVEVGGGVRTYRVGDRAVLDAYAVDEMCPGAHGTPLVPWPNRLADGAYSFDGADYQLALTEPAKGNAIHGLLRWCNWQLVSREPSEVVLGYRLHLMAGYPFALDVRVGYRLDDDGLTVTTTATNIGVKAAPWACGAHPYLSPGSGLVDDATLQFSAERRIETDDKRQLPTGETGVRGTQYDFANPRRIGDLELDNAFRGLARDPAGKSRVRLTGPDDRTAELWMDETYSVLELFTGDTLSPEHKRRGLGVEPMTAPPNAFATGDDVLRLEPGRTTTHRWGVRIVD